MPAPNNNGGGGKPQQRFHANRNNSMKIGLRGLMFTINPQNEPKAYRELSALMEKILADYPQEYFQQLQQKQQEQEKEGEEEDENQNQNDDDQDDQEQEESTAGGSGSTFADELQAELEGLKEDKSSSGNAEMVARTGSDENNNVAEDENHSNNNNRQKKRKNFPPRRFRMIDTNCKGFAFVAINFSDELEAADRIPVVEAEQQDHQSTTNVITLQANQQVFNFCVGKIPSLIMEISKKIVTMVIESDVPILRFTYYLYPCLSTAAPTVHSAIVLAEATKVLVPIPKGKSAAKIETHFTVRNNSGVSQPVVLDELKKNFKERLPMSKYFVVNANAKANNVAQRRQRENDEKNGTVAPRIINASITYFVLHSAALLCLQPDYSEMKEYALHKIGASFADSMNEDAAEKKN